jgi:hypothetical protein
MMKHALLTAASIIGLSLTPTASLAQTAPQTVVTSEVDAEGREALAYSLAIQAYLYSYPLFIWERERLRRENLTESPSARSDRTDQPGWAI